MKAKLAIHLEGEGQGEVRKMGGEKEGFQGSRVLPIEMDGFVMAIR
jgi:hypothetical protein